MALTEMVIMPGEDYQAICDSVRAKTGGTELLKSGEVAPAIDGIEINTGIDTSDGTAVANDIAYGKTAYVNGEKIIGNIPVDSYIDTNAQTYWDSSTKRFNLYSFPEERVIIGTKYSNEEQMDDMVDLYCPGSKLGNAAAKDVIQGKTFTSENGMKITGTIPEKTGTDITVNNGAITIPTGFYSSNITKTDSNLVAGNIKSGVSIFGVTGTFNPLPNRVVKMTSGSFTPTSDISGDYYITHGLGSNADFFMVWPSVIPSNYYSNYLRFTCGFSDQNVFTNIESFESAYLIHWYSDGSGHYSPGVYWRGSINFNTSFPVITSNNSLSLKSGVTYYWIAGTLA